MAGTSGFTRKDFIILMRNLFPVAAFICLLWVSHLAIYFTQINTDGLALFPRTIHGFPGVFFTPFIHGSFRHLASNTFPLAVLGASLFYFYKEIAYRVFVIIYLGGDFLVWLIARPNFHVGASGIVYGMAAFLIVSAFLRKKIALLAIAMIMVYLFGNMIWGMFPMKYAASISWEAHLCGAAAGLFCAVIYRKYGPEDDKEDDGDDAEISDRIIEEAPPPKKLDF